MADQLDLIAEGHIAADVAERSYPHALTEPGAWLDGGRRMHIALRHR
jgi:hypothetical protein